MATGSVAERVSEAMAESVLIRTVESVRQDGGVQVALGGASVRPLTDAEIEQLERQGNVCDDWSKVRVADGFDPARVCRSRFHGDVVLGAFAGQCSVGGAELPTGIVNSTLVDAVVGNEALIQDVRLLAKYVVGPEAVLINCGSVICDGQTQFGNGQELEVGIETGGREVAVFAELDVEVAAEVARLRAAPEQLEAYQAAVKQYAERATCDRGIICQKALIRDTAQVRNSFIGAGAKIDGATVVANSTLLSEPDEPAEVLSGACVTDSVLQWGCEAASMAIIDRSVMTEHSHAERHGKVTACIVGPNTGIAEGEATACLLGPFVGFHHQALLIAAYWPEGKGNIGYGANVGSNHTSKAPDQELWPGEGLFLGLGVNVKFPADFSKAPYSILASGVTTLPQRVTFPFSLINSPAEVIDGISPAYNEIIPGWVLSNNIYTLKRNEGKYEARNKARRTKFNFSVFRPDTVELMLDACRRLEAVKETKPVYTDRDIPGLGKNYMREAVRQPAIDAYRFYLRYYALMALMNRVKALLDGQAEGSVAEVLDKASEDEVWESQRRLLTEELGVSDVRAALQELPDMLQKIAKDVEESKAKDDRRGAKIIEDYNIVHTPASEDSFVKKTYAATAEQIEQINALISRLS
ncbi:MAG: DUF4954 family protein [Planctomycetes bacterium]|nr:DUF4954 family protein [Planctomycetota bacterium]